MFVCPVIDQLYDVKPFFENPLISFLSRKYDLNLSLLLPSIYHFVNLQFANLNALHLQGTIYLKHLLTGLSSIIFGLM